MMLFESALVSRTNVVSGDCPFSGREDFRDPLFVRTSNIATTHQFSLLRSIRSGLIGPYETILACGRVQTRRAAIAPARRLPFDNSTCRWNRMSARHSPYGGTSSWMACGRPKRTLSRARLNVRDAPAYTSWSTVFCHLPDSSSHKATMTADAAPCGLTHRSSQNLRAQTKRQHR
jgi:hypothetical protein